MVEYCEEELIVDSVLTYCIREQSHNGDCMFADPELITKETEENSN